MRRIPLWAWFGVLFAVPTALTFVPGQPVHGYGYVWLALPLLFWFREPRQRRRLLLYVGALVLQLLAYPDPDLGFLGWTLLVPWLAARELDDGASWWRTAFLFGFLRAMAGFFWLAHIHFTGWFGVALPSGLAFALLFEGTVRYARFLPYALRVAAGWALFEWAHSFVLGGFPWLYLSHTQHAYPALIQAADVVGAFGVSFVLAYAQAAAFDAGRSRRPTAELVAAAALVSATVAYGLLRRGPEAADGGPAVLLVQSSYSHAVKAQKLVPEPVQWAHLRRLTREGLREHPEAALVVWAETMYPFAHLEGAPGARAGFPEVAREIRRPAVYGINTFASMESVRKLRGHNSAVLVDTAGEVRGVYRKQRLVPMGEDFLPRRLFAEETCDRWFEWLVRNIGYPRNCNLEAGEGYATLDAGEGLRCAVLICFEGLYPDMARAASREGEPDLLLHLVNNGWFGPYEPRQAVASWVFRAVETRMPFLSCANAGITCAVGPDGRLLGKVDRVMEDGVLLVRVPPRWSEPLFVRGGYLLLPVVLGLLAGAFLARNLLRKGREGGRRGPSGPS